MSVVRTATALPFIALLFGLTCAPAVAFSQIGREDGTLPDQDGVISVPLPPLTNGEAQASPPAAPPAGAQPASPDAQPPAGTAPGAAPPAETPAAPGVAPAPDAPQPSPAAPPPAAEPGAPAPGAAPIVPLPDAGTPGDGADTEEPAPDRTGNAEPTVPSGPPADVFYGEAELPGPVRDLRARLMEIARSGEIEKLRPYLQTGEDATVLSLAGADGDPIEYLKSGSGDGEGIETLAILLEVLEAGHVHNEPGTANEIYVWPYFTGVPIDKLTKPQKVELFELVTAGDYQEMTAFGAYNFYRVGITPDGKLQFFVAGD